jgi:hypothetical protein
MNENIFTRLEQQTQFYKHIRQQLKAGLRQYLFSLLLLASVRILLIVSVWAIVLFVFWRDINGTYKVFVIVGAIIYLAIEAAEFKSKSYNAAIALQEARRAEEEASNFLLAALKTYDLEAESVTSEESEGE